jgi:serine/threonine protein kinase
VGARTESSERGAQDRRTDAAALGDERTLAAPTAPASAPEPDRLPTVPREAYTVWGEVAQGGIGRVLRARDQRLDRPVAIKELLVWNEAQEQRFMREALLTASDHFPVSLDIDI